MKRILTSLPYERRIGLPGAAGGIPVTDSIRRTLLLPVADTHLDPDVESAAGQLVKCDVSGSLLADLKLRGYSEHFTVSYEILVDAGATLIELDSGYDYIAFHRVLKPPITGAYICDSLGVVLQELYIDKLIRAKGVRWKCYLIITGQAGFFLNIVGHYFR